MFHRCWASAPWEEEGHGATSAVLSDAPETRAYCVQREDVQVGVVFVGTATLMLSSKELMSLILRVIVYEPYSCFHFALFGFWFGSQSKSTTIIPASSKQSHWMFSLSCCSRSVFTLSIISTP